MPETFVNTGMTMIAGWDTQGGAGAHSPGKVTGGGRKSGYEILKRRGIAGEEAHSAGSISWGGSFDLILQPDSKALFQAAYRAAYPATTMTLLEFTMGTTTRKWFQGNAQINTAKIKAAMGEAATGSVEWMAMADGTSQVVTAQTAPTIDTLFEWYDGSFTYEAEAVLATSVEWSITNNLFYYENIDSRVATAKRKPVGLLAGVEEHEITVESMKAPEAMTAAFDVNADIPSSAIDLILILTDHALMPTLMTLTFTNLMFNGEHSFAYTDASGIDIYKYGFTGKPHCLAIT